MPEPGVLRCGSPRRPPPARPVADLPAMAGVRVAVLGPGAGCRVGNVVKGVFQYSGPEEGVHEHKWIRVCVHHSGH